MSAFLNRYSAAFGRQSSLVLKLVGLDGFEVSASGTEIYDDKGQTWLDFGSFGVHLLGHSQPSVRQAVVDQLGKMGLSSKILGNDEATTAALRLSKLVNVSSDVPISTVFANSGSEAVETTIKLCRLATGRHRFLALTGSYHGRTDGALQLSYSASQNSAAPEHSFVTFVDPGDLGQLTALLETREFAGLFIEPIQGEGGIHPIDPNFLDAARTRCTDFGTMMVSDEIQAGLGRGGRIIHRHDADAIILGKALSGGYMPVSAVLYRSKVFGSKAADPIAGASSYSNSPIGGAAVNAVLDIVEKPDFLTHIRSLSKDFQDSLLEAVQGFDVVESIRGRGLMIGVEFDSPASAGAVLTSMLSERVLVTFCLSQPSVLRFFPPTTATPAQCQQVVSALRNALETLSGTSSSSTAIAA